MAKRKTWKEKLANANGLPKVESLTGKWMERHGGGTIAIPAPMDVDAIMKQVPPGKLITINEIRDVVAEKHGATMACPITSGIFAWIAAHAAEEDSAAGEEEITPYWRTLKVGGELNPKYPGGVDYLRAMLESEGHTVVTKGKRTFVKDYQGSLVKPAS
jgi:hypothetical protein